MTRWILRTLLPEQQESQDHAIVELAIQSLASDEPRWTLNQNISLETYWCHELKLRARFVGDKFCDLEANEVQLGVSSSQRKRMSQTLAERKSHAVQQDREKKLVAFSDNLAAYVASHPRNS